MLKQSRSKLVVEPAIQYSLVRQLIVQWILHLIASVLLLTILQVFLGGPFQPWEFHWQRIWPAAASLSITLLFLAPPFILSSLQLSNRFVGPIHRMRHMLRELAAGRQADRLAFRSNDFWQEVAGEFEQAMEALNERKPAPDEPRTNSPDETGVPKASGTGTSGKASGIVLDSTESDGTSFSPSETPGH